MSIRRSDKTPLRPRIVIAAGEYPRLMDLAERAIEQDSPVGEYLAEELSRAHIVPDEQCSPYVVRIGSRVTYTDDATSRLRKVTLVYPHDADIESNRISVLTPIGAALIGMSPAQSIQWLSPDGSTGSLTVLDVETPD